MPVTIRPARLADAAALAELAARTFHETFAADNRPEDMAAHEAESYSPALQGREIADPDIVTILFHIGEELVGFSQVRRGPAPACVTDTSAVELWRFYIAKPHHGTGIAQALMTRALDDANQMGARTLWLGVWERNERAKAFYRKSGFTDVGAHVYMVGTDAQTDRIMMRAVVSTCKICAKIPDYNYSSGFSTDAFPPEVYRLVDPQGAPLVPGCAFDGTTALRCPLCGGRYEFLCEVGFGEWDLTIKRLS